MISRTNRGLLADWWWEIDRLAVSAMLALIGIGLVLAFAASPAETARHSATHAGNFYYAIKQVVFALIAIGIAIGTSLLSLRSIKVAALVIFVVSVVASALVLVAGPEVLGARRWIDVGGMTLQPSEFLKPSFVVLCAAILAGQTRISMSRELASLVLLVIPLVLLVAEPDIGQTGLLLALWGAMLFFDGISLAWIGMITGAGTTLAGIAYLLVPHVHHRIEQFFAPGKPGFQTGLSMKAFEHGGLTGVGPGAGTIKYRIPYAHSDFVYAVAGEEFGFVLCALIAMLFCALSVRLLLRASSARDRFSQLAAAGLSLSVALQAFINMGVAVHLLPAKGMTLPFISYGGSSLFAVALTMGFAFGITRQRPESATNLRQPMTVYREAAA
ncbi:MAG TPA: FtsW/RodA/SpoVE family cell cycle protein [Rhizomicrobium sp.]|jgi:cell division protein FtsW